MTEEEYRKILEEIKELYYEKTIKTATFTGSTSTSTIASKPLDMDALISMIKNMGIEKDNTKIGTDLKFNQELWDMAAKYIKPYSCFSLTL